MKTLQKLALGLGASVIAIGTGLTFYTQQRFGTDPLTHIFQPVRQTMTWPPQPQPIGALQFSPDGQSIFTLSGDVDFLDILSGNVSSSEITTRLPEEGATATVRQWDFATNTLIDPQSLPSEFTSSNLGRVLTSVDGRWVAASGRGTLRLYDLRTDTSLAIANAPESSRLDNVHLAFSPDSQQIALRGDQEIQIRETASGRLLNTFETTPHGRFLTFSSDGQTLISSNPDGSLSRWPVATGDVSVWFTIAGSHDNP
ncbi:MAG: WD40 repeat domain-containing protein [Cyanophyceae cyanobacterium]